MRDVTPEEVQQAMKEQNISRVSHHNCGRCNQVVAYHVVDGKLFLNHVCDCVDKGMCPREWSTLSNWINTQSNLENKRSLAAKVGITL